MHDVKGEEMTKSPPNQTVVARNLRPSDVSADASRLTRLSSTGATRLIQSTGNLYWSSNSGEPPSSITSAIFRASKSNQPGEEVQLYAETGQTDFEALTFAKVNNEFYGYFVANYGNVSQIKRIPLGSVTPNGQATIMANCPAPVEFGDLVTDGSFLCWADHEGIRSMPIGGGQVTTLAAGNNLHLSVLGRTLYYTDGNAILSVPTGGGTPSTVVGNRLSPITALHVLEVPRPNKVAERLETPGQPIDPLEELVLIWGEADGGIHSTYGDITTYPEPNPSVSVDAVYATEQRALWSTLYFTPDQTNAVNLGMNYGNVTVTLASMDNTGDDGFTPSVLADEVAAHWNVNGYIEKYTF
jgi:hypothetical protein